MKTYGDLLELGCSVLQDGEARLSKDNMTARWDYEIPPYELRIEAGLLEARNVLMTSVREMLLSHFELADEASILIDPQTTELNQSDPFVDYIYERFKALAPVG